MTPERWQQVRQVLDAALALQFAERKPFVENVCSSDPDLLREVESLLFSDEQAGSRFLNTPVIDLASATSVAIPIASHVGRRIGAYDILEEIGRGGMGEVYRAVRADGQYTKEVAVKLVRGGEGTRSVLERFRMERQILAGLDHPNIARLLDGGTTEDGIPYLVMELIVGVPVDAYCDAQILSITERLRLFRQVCGAVQYAHQRLVIHRDLKPSNILVTEDGSPKLLDFGIAKLLDPTVTTESTLAHPMTPEYASPEQIRGEPITTATDVYSLGVVLYQLLTGRSPYARETRSSHELARAICETDPTRPSSAVLKSPIFRSSNEGQQFTAEHVSGFREGSPAKLHKRLAGDLDSIVMQALRKEARRRYPSVDQLAEDIRRHLDGLPVLATKGSWKYRAGKFVTRHKVGVIASAAVALALIGGVAATVRAARIARQQAEIARVEREHAEKRFDDVRKLANSLIFEIHDSIQNLPGAAPSRKLLLDRAVEYLDKLSQESNGDVDLQRELAWGYQRLAAVQGDSASDNLGQISDSEVSMRKAIALFEAVAKANPHNVTDQLNLAMTYRTRAFGDVYVSGGRAEIDQALAVTAPLMQTDGASLDVKSERSSEYQILAAVQDAVGDRLQAVDSFRKYLELRQEIERADPSYKRIHKSVAKATVQLAFQLGLVGSFEEAMPLMQSGINEYEQLAKSEGIPDTTRDFAASIMRRGNIELMQGHAAAAHASFAQSRELLVKLAKRDPDNVLFKSDLLNLDFADGRVLLFNGHYAEALPKLQAAFDGYAKLKLEGDTGPGDGMMQLFIGDAQSGSHNLSAAMAAYQKGMATFAKDESQYDDARCDLAAAYTRIGDTLFKMGKLGEASDWYNKAVDKANVGGAIQHQDFQAFYPAADAYAGLARISVALAGKAANDNERSKQLISARDYYKKSMDAWGRIPNATRISPDTLQFEDPQRVAREATAVTAQLR